MDQGAAAIESRFSVSRHPSASATARLVPYGREWPTAALVLFTSEPLTELVRSMSFLKLLFVTVAPICALHLFTSDPDTNPVASISPSSTPIGILTRPLFVPSLT